MKKLTHIFILLSSFILQAQTDSLDLSEIPSKITLPKELEENSGLQYINGFLYTINDGGGKAEVYKLNPENGEIVQTIVLKNAKNVDFEAITYDGKYMYVGDFGNNLGNRKDLKIYKFKLSSVDANKAITNVSVDVLKFTLGDQFNYKEQENRTTNYDIEAMIFYDDKIHLFTKEWSSGKTTHHTLETFYAFQNSKKKETLDVQGLVTDASIKDNELILVGYTQDGIAFQCKLYDFSNGEFFNGKVRRTFLGLTPSVSQIEGVTISDNGYYISGEALSFSGFSHPQTLYFIPKK